MAKKKNEAFEYIWRDRKRTFCGLPWSFTTYFLTASKFVTRVGWLSLDEDELDLYKAAEISMPRWAACRSRTTQSTATSRTTAITARATIIPDAAPSAANTAEKRHTDT